MHRIVMAFALIVFAWPAAATARSIDDCESIKDADAYNRCLADFGPVRGARRSGHGSAYVGKHYGKRHWRGYSSVQQGRSGRQRMEFTPGGR
jgi:hypothetical protein